MLAPVVAVVHNVCDALHTSIGNQHISRQSPQSIDPSEAIE